MTNASTERAIQFVSVWQSAKNVKEVADEFGITPSGASTIAANYRKQGVPLKKFSNRGIDWKAVTRAAKEAAE